MSKKIFQILLFCGITASMNEARAVENAPPAPTCATACGSLESFCKEQKIDFKEVNNYCTDQILTTFGQYVSVDCSHIKTALSDLKLQKALLEFECSEVKNACMNNCVLNLR